VKAARTANNLVLPFPGAIQVSLAQEQGSPSISWSRSRRAVLEQCLRRYYYDYYAVSVARAQNAPVLEQLRFLKAIQNRYQRTGSIAHLVIATGLRRAQHKEVWDADHLRNWARKLFRADVEYSQQHSKSASSATRGLKPVLLHEHYYGIANASDLCRAAEQRLLDAITAFAEDTRLEEFRREGSRAGAIVEGSASFAVFGNRASGKIDLAFMDGPLVTIADWKLGEPGSRADDSLQLGAYALWAEHAFRTVPAAIRVCNVHLRHGEVVWFPVSDKSLANTRARIAQDFERIRLMHEYGEQGIVEAFTPCVQPKVCALCPYQSVCAEGRAVLNA